MYKCSTKLLVTLLLTLSGTAFAADTTCVIEVKATKCNNSNPVKLNEYIYDVYQNSNVDMMRCFARAQEYHAYCRLLPGDAVKATFFAGTNMVNAQQFEHAPNPALPSSYFSSSFCRTQPYRDLYCVKVKVTTFSFEDKVINVAGGWPKL